jgi:anti-sigma28 factor (negative regulator of flagellin synthesis)
VKISTEQIEKIKAGEPIAQTKVNAAVIKLMDADLIKEVVAKVNNTPDREETVNDIKQRIANGTYNPTGDEIVDTMLRRAIADRIKD